MKTVNSTVWSISLMLCLSLAAVGCEQSQARASTDPTATTTAAETVAAKQSTSKVTKIVFVGKEHPCDCTRKTVDAGWAALQKALGTPPKVPVERLQIDTEGDKVAPYQNQKPMMALPGIYFVDGKNVVLEMLQGEISEAQVTAVLKR
jgi:hypothetical protein